MVLLQGLDWSKQYWYLTESSGSEAPPNVNEFFQNIHDANFAMFHEEPNIQYASGNCVEFAFLKMARSFFHDVDDEKEEATATPSNETAHSNKTALWIVGSTSISMT